MEWNEYVYHLNLLEALDPDQLVTDLGLTTEDIIAAHPEKVKAFIEDNYG